ncbi:hypothetical protein ACIBCB_10150 [Streptomyces uncialis]|uniref:hypothetical protein n=1 Tax=Streptomyces uncialis TaxID=1048205 RepID=UPI002E324FF4|nr:hypothetical protein [Streptomyces uncialis]
MEQDGRRVEHGIHGIDRATRWAGVLLCWAHAAAMALTAAEAMLRSATDWWVVTWAATAVLFITWALLRAAQKRLLRRAASGEDGQDDPSSPEESTHYDRAA